MSVEVNELVKEVKKNESTINIKIDRIIVESIDELKHLDSFSFNDNDYRYMGHDLVKSSPSTHLEKGFTIKTTKIYDVCTHCKSDMMFDEIRDEYYCPICYTEPTGWLQKILKAVR